MMKTILNKVGFYRSELEAIRDCFVCGIIEGADDGGVKFLQLSFYNSATQMYMLLRFYEDGTMCASAPFAEKE